MLVLFFNDLLGADRFYR